MNDIAKRSMAPPVRADDEQHQQQRPNPLKALPEGWREPVSFFYAFHSDILKGTAGLVARLRMWAKDDGLTLAEAREVMRLLMRPEKCAGFQYAGQLLASLAELVAAKCKERKARGETAKRTADAARAGVELRRIRSIAAGIGGGA